MRANHKPLTVGLGVLQVWKSNCNIAFGSNFAQKYKLSQKIEFTLCLWCCAAGIALHLTQSIQVYFCRWGYSNRCIDFQHLFLLYSVQLVLVSKVILSQDVILVSKCSRIWLSQYAILHLLLGILAGLVSVYHARNFRKVEHFLAKLKPEFSQKHCLC
jgi:CIC family chloride channel protein